MKFALASLMLLSSLTVPAQARPGRNIGDISNRQAYQSQSGYARQEKCFKKVYREEYVPGTMRSPGYVKTYSERVRVPCKRERTYYNHKHHHHHHRHVEPKVDDNSCIEGAILGGIGGAGIGAAASRGDGRLWAIPLGIIGGSMVGCQIDGG